MESKARECWTSWEQTSRCTFQPSEMITDRSQESQHNLTFLYSSICCFLVQLLASSFCILTSKFYKWCSEYMIAVLTEMQPNPKRLEKQKGGTAACCSSDRTAGVLRHDKQAIVPLKAKLLVFRVRRKAVLIMCSFLRQKSKKQKSMSFGCVSTRLSVYYSQHQRRWIFCFRLTFGSWPQLWAIGSKFLT